MRGRFRRGFREARTAGIEMATLDLLWAGFLKCRAGDIAAGLRHRLRGICILDMRGLLRLPGGMRGTLAACW